MNWLVTSQPIARNRSQSYRVTRDLHSRQDHTPRTEVIESSVLGSCEQIDPSSISREYQLKNSKITTRKLHLSWASSRSKWCAVDEPRRTARGARKAGELR